MQQHQHAAPQNSMPSPYVPLPPHASYSGYPPNQSHQPSYQPVITPHPQQSYPPPAISYAPSLYSQQTHSSQQTYPSNQVYPPSSNPYPPTGTYLILGWSIPLPPGIICQFKHVWIWCFLFAGPYQGIYPPPPYWCLAIWAICVLSVNQTWKWLIKWDKNVVDLDNCWFVCYVVCVLSIIYRIKLLEINFV